MSTNADPASPRPPSDAENQGSKTIDDWDLIVLDSVDDNDDTDQLSSSNEKNTQHMNDADSNAEVPKLRKEIQALRKENARLKQHIHRLKKKRNKHSPIEVLFHNRFLAKHCKVEVEEFLRNLIHKYEKEINRANEDADDKCHGPIQLEISHNFCVDSMVIAHQYDSKAWKAPIYDQVYGEALENQISGEVAAATAQKESGSPKKIGGTCFNCLGSHMMNECPKELDSFRIRKNRSKLFKPSVKSNRYHVEEQRSNCFQPGTISENLRHALDLQPNQLPPYIYRMRILGYPPGWMKEAEIESSGLTMYDSEGKAMANHEDTEDGEVDINTIRVQHDPKKLIDFPGFNVYPAVGTLDEADKYGAPPLQRQHLRTFVERTMKPPDPRPYRKKKLPSVFEEKAKKAKVNRAEEDMEVEDTPDGTIIDDPENDESCKFIPPLPPDSPSPPPPPSDSPLLEPEPPTDIPLPEIPSNLNLSNNISATSSRSSSPSLTDLEEAKMKLMKELEQVGDSSNTEDTSQQGGAQPAASARSDSTSGASDTDSSSSSKRRSGELKRVKCHHHSSPSLMVAPGTPICQNYSSFSKLPSAEKFSKDITDHLLFENLPNSTGKYDKMRGVLKRVREKIQEA